MCPERAYRYSFLAHEPIVDPVGPATTRAGGAGYAVREQAIAANRVLAAADAMTPRIAIVGPAAVASDDVPRFDVPTPSGTLDEQLVALDDPRWHAPIADRLGEHATLVHHAPAAWIAHQLGIPMLCSLHSHWPRVLRQLTATASDDHASRAKRCAAVLQSAKAVLVSTTEERAMLLSAYEDVEGLAMRVHVVPHAISSVALDASRDARRNAQERGWRRRLVPQAALGDVIFGVVARVVPYKRIANAIAAFTRIAHQIPRARLLIVGPQTDRLYAAQCRALGDASSAAHRIHWAGPQPLVGAYHAMDVLVHLSVHETWSRAIDEAMAFGRPIVAAASPFLAERLERPPHAAKDNDATDHRALWIDIEQGDEPHEALSNALVRAASDASWREACGAYHASLAHARDPLGPAKTLLRLWDDVEFAAHGTRPFAHVTR